ncbi:SurA N-terminal domain-containing protein [Amphibacillus cookii]|uniref:SurA N-terminal domain-containing protein n=1 Tax=Amphibacillus cookii TaxID=767787 RepID=UPI00195E4E35|nr:SurA N-terminal domain-containing protein [Amphibacillus cookii]MBM7541745.1 hypothetical protein [Amphibacillus cookii]
MFNAKRMHLLLIISLGLLLIFSLLIRPNHFFEEKEKKIELVDSKAILVEGDDFTVTEAEYMDYKENIKRVHKLNGVEFDLTDEEILDDVIENKLLLQDAREKGVEVTKDEVLAYAEQTKEAFEQNATPELEQTHISLAEELNVSPADYFTHPDVLKQYEDVIKLNKLAEKISVESELNSPDSLDHYIEELKESKADTYKINEQIFHKEEK